MAIFLFGMALLLGDLWKVRFRLPALAALVMAALFTSLSLALGWMDSDCQEESNYFCIKVRERQIEGHRVLTLDQLLHSYVAMDDPSFLVYGYEKVTADLAALQYVRIDSFDTLFIGGGGYTMPRLIEMEYPDAAVEVIEIDPVVTQVAHSYLGLPQTTSIVTYNLDARMKIPDLPKGKYAMIAGDAFNDFSIPYHLTTLEFNQQVKELLAPGGLFVVNIVDNLNSGRFLRAYVHTLSRTFDHIYILQDEDLWEEDSRSNVTYVVVGTDQAINAEDLDRANRKSGRGTPVSRFMPQDIFDRWYRLENPILLTDGFVPVDQLIAPLYLRSR